MPYSEELDVTTLRAEIPLRQAENELRDDGTAKASSTEKVTRTNTDVRMYMLRMLSTVEIPVVYLRYGTAVRCPLTAGLMRVSVRLRLTAALG